MALSRGSKWFLAFVALGLAGFAALLYVLDGILGPDIEPGQPVAFVVEPGESVRSVGDRLRDLGVVRSSTTFRLAADDAGLAATLQPGEYELETGMSNDEAIDVLLAGPVGPVGVRFTVPEGLSVELTLAQLARQFDAYDVADFRAVLDARTEAGDNADGVLQLPDWVPEPADVLEADDEAADADTADADTAPIEPYEGLLFPETYEVDREATPLAILQRMVDQLEQVMASVPDEDVEAAEARGLSRYEVLILASLVEREVRVPAERGTVAGVIHNRLEEGMRLQIDATVLYAVGKHTEIVAVDDLDVDSPYNTYRVEGLPPTPIAGIGEASLRAAFAPDDVPYRFYVLDPSCDFSHAFAETLEEHEANVAAFREADRCQ